MTRAIERLGRADLQSPAGQRDAETDLILVLDDYRHCGRLRKLPTRSRGSSGVSPRACVRASCPCLRRLRSSWTIQSRILRSIVRAFPYIFS
jgi:hypothetical protein